MCCVCLFIWVIVSIFLSKERQASCLPASHFCIYTDMQQYQASHMNLFKEDTVNPTGMHELKQEICSPVHHQMMCNYEKRLYTEEKEVPIFG